MKRKIGQCSDKRNHYGHGLYRRHWACFDCRKMFNLYRPLSLCPVCRQPMHNTGWDFKAPRKADKKQWEKVILLYRKGIRWQSPTSHSGCHGPGHHFRTLREAKEYELTRST